MERSSFSVLFANMAFSLKGEQNELIYADSTRDWHPVATNRPFLDWGKFICALQHGKADTHTQPACAGTKTQVRGRCVLRFFLIFVEGTRVHRVLHSRISEENGGGLPKWNLDLALNTGHSTKISNLPEFPSFKKSILSF
jgi:hypothetical protein